MNNTAAHSSRSLVYSFPPTLRQADTQIPLINWDAGSQHVNTEEDKQATDEAPYLLHVLHCAPLFNLHQMVRCKRWRCHVRYSGDINDGFVWEKKSINILFSDFHEILPLLYFLLIINVCILFIDSNVWMILSEAKKKKLNSLWHWRWRRDLSWPEPWHSAHLNWKKKTIKGED